MSLCGAAHCEHTTGERLLQNGVSAVPALGILHLAPQCLAVPDHGRDTQLGVFLGVDGRRLDEEDAARILIYDVADAVIDEFALANLRRSDHDNATHLRI